MLDRFVVRGYCALLLGAVALSTNAQCAPVSDSFKLEYSFAVYGYSKSQRFSRPSGLFYDKNRGELYVADTGNGQIAIFDNKGMPISRLQHFVQDISTGERRLGEPRSMVVRKNGDILVADNLCEYIDVLDFRGRSVQKLWLSDLFGSEEKSKVRPGSLALDTAENLYVSVAGDKNAILVISPDFKLKAEIGKVSGPDGALQAVSGIWVDTEGKIYATYVQGDCVRIYSPDGRMLVAFGKHDTGYDNFSLPAGLVTDARENIWIADTLRHAVTVFRQEKEDARLRTQIIHALGGLGSMAGYMAYPTAIAGDGSTRIFVLEGTGARVQAFKILFNEETDKKETAQ